MKPTPHPIRNDKTSHLMSVTRHAMTIGRVRRFGSNALSGHLAVLGLAAIMVLAVRPTAYALPLNGAVVQGNASIATTPITVTVHQTTQNAAINWQSFGIGVGQSVTFQQPNSNSVALNRVLGPDPSSILGSLSANGQVFIVNPSGILFGKGAQVNVGGLVASTLGITDANFMKGNYKFAGSSSGAVLNRGSINADGGYVALLGADVSNTGVISARLGTVALAAGSAVTLDVAGDGLLNVAVDQGAVNALVKNGGLIKANGGRVVMTAQAAGQLLKTAVNNTGVIEAQTIDTHNGTISLLGDMQSGTVNVSGTLDASAPNGGNGGVIETSAAQVNIAPTAKITTAAPKGVTGTWLIDPVDFIVASSGGNITGTTLGGYLVNNSVVISTYTSGTDNTVAGTPPVKNLFSAKAGSGDIIINDAIAGWTATPSTTTLTLNALHDLIVNAAITATNGNLVACCGHDITVNAAISTTNGSVLLSAGHDVTLTPISAITTVNGNIEICAADNIYMKGAGSTGATITLTQSSNIVPAQGLQDLIPPVPFGLTLIAGNGGTGPGVAGGTLVVEHGSTITVTGQSPTIFTPVNIYYNPTSYATPTDYSTDPNLTWTPVDAHLIEHMLVFPAAVGSDGSTAATLTGGVQ